MSDVRVAVVGAGMAGLAAALRLAERGYKVTVYEARPYIGGQFSAHTHDDPSGADVRYHEHSYHMLLNWYGNFWQMVEDIGLSREWDFEPRVGIRHLAEGDFPARRRGHGRAGGRGAGPGMPALVNPGLPAYIRHNLFSGIAPPPDVFLYAYSLIDLLSRSFDADRLLDEYTVNGFLQSRPYASERCAELHAHTLAKAFAWPSYLSSAASYQNFIKYGFADPEPMMWVLKGDSQRHFHDFLEAKLRATNRCDIRTLHRVTGIDVRRGATSSDLRAAGVRYLELEKDDTEDECVVGDYTTMSQYTRSPALPARATRERQRQDERVEYDYVILAVPPGALSPLALGIRDVLRPKLSESDHVILALRRRLLDFVPRLKTQSMASLDLYFNKKLDGIPKEHVVLLDSEFGLTFIDNSQAWPGHTRTVLNVIASDFGSLSHVAPAHAEFVIIQELKRYIPFEEQRDLDLEKTHFQTNVGDRLFVNEVGSWQWRPEAQTVLPNLFLAGDYCRTSIDVVTVEGAVMSGLEAAKALQRDVIAERRLRPDDPLAKTIPIVEPEAYSDAEMKALKLLLAPHAYVAKAWSWLYEQAAARGPGAAMWRSPNPWEAIPEPIDLASAGVRLALTPWLIAADWWETGWSVWSAMARQSGYGR
jgi:uncharacterized protein with NAD-binding domain and iron-sulfur cluster